LPHRGPLSRDRMSLLPGAGEVSMAGQPQATSFIKLSIVIRRILEKSYKRLTEFMDRYI
jgi:hypothetical protein